MNDGLLVLQVMDESHSEATLTYGWPHWPAVSANWRTDWPKTTAGVVPGEPVPGACRN